MGQTVDGCLVFNHDENTYITSHSETLKDGDHFLSHNRNSNNTFIGLVVGKRRVNDFTFIYDENGDNFDPNVISKVLFSNDPELIMRNKLITQLPRDFNTPFNLFNVEKDNPIVTIDTIRENNEGHCPYCGRNYEWICNGDMKCYDCTTYSLIPVPAQPERTNTNDVIKARIKRVIDDNFTPQMKKILIELCREEDSEDFR